MFQFATTCLASLRIKVTKSTDYEAVLSLCLARGRNWHRSERYEKHLPGAKLTGCQFRSTFHRCAFPPERGSGPTKSHIQEWPEFSSASCFLGLFRGNSGRESSLSSPSDFCTFGISRPVLSLDTFQFSFSSISTFCRCVR